MSAATQESVKAIADQFERHVRAIFEDSNPSFGTTFSRDPVRANMDAYLDTGHHLFSKVILNFGITEATIASFIVVVEGVSLTAGDPTPLLHKPSEFVGWLSLASMTLEALKKDPEWFRARGVRKTGGALSLAGISFPPGRRVAVHRLPDSVLLFAAAVRDKEGQLAHVAQWKAVNLLGGLDRALGRYFVSIEMP